MLLVTTLSTGQLSDLVKNKRVSLNNEDLLFGKPTESVRKYIEERLGGSGYVVAIRGRINPASADFLSKLDRGLKGDKFILETQVDPDDLLVFDMGKLVQVAEFIAHGFPDEYVEEALDEAQQAASDGSLQAVCLPYIRKEGNIKITSLDPRVNIDVSQADITFVKLNGGGQR